MAHHCREFSRSALLRQGIAEAGRGLPAIEPGMPLPAGTGLDRRSFISRTLGAALTVYGASALGPRAFDAAIARAYAAGRSDRVFVSIFAPGGWDALSAPLSERRPELPEAPTRARLQAGGRPAASERLPPPLAPVARPARQAARQGQGHRLPGDRLHAPGPVALHLASLLGGRRARPATAAPAGSAGSST